MTRHSMFTSSATLIIRASGSTEVGPPELMVALANAVHAHPWYPSPCFALDPSTGYVSSWAAYNQANLLAGLIPRWEGPNELWNYVYTCTGYADNKEFLRTGANYDHDNWYGQAISLEGQEISAAYGDPSAASRPSKYWVVASMSAGDDHGLPTRGGGNKDNKLASPAYVSEGGSAAYNWITHVSFAGYWSTRYWNTISELGWAYWYSNGANSTQKATLIGNYLAGSTPTGPPSEFTLPHMQSIMTSFANYASSYSSLASIGVTQYEGGNVECLVGGAGCPAYASPSAKVTGITTGITTNSYHRNERLELYL